jgi:uncharacterized RDD family membrane protein YckC
VNQEQVTERLDVEYPKAKLYKRWFSALIDLFIATMIGLIFFSLAGLTTQHVSSYISVAEKRSELQRESGLYDDSNQLLTVVEENSTDTYDAKKKVLSKALDSYYLNETFFQNTDAMLAYQGRKSTAKNSNSNNLFIEDSSNHGYYLENGGLDEDYYNFYSTEIENYAIGQMTSNEDYLRLTQVIFITSISELVVSIALGFLISFCLIPVFIKRGRKTVGMYLFKISLIGADALNVNGWKYFGRAALVFLVGFVLDAVTVLIPLIVSITMMHFSKSGQDFFDYVANTYVVATDKKDVYLSYSEYLSRTSEKQNASIENRDFNLKSH